MSALLQTQRWRLEQKIEELIELLDLVDGEPDLEDTGDDEPSAGDKAYVSRCGTAHYDLEEDPAESGIGDHDAFSLIMGPQDWTHSLSCDGRLTVSEKR